MVVALDIEGTIANILESWIHHYDKNFSIEDVFIWDFTNLKEKWGESLDSFLTQTAELWIKSPLSISPFLPKQQLKEATDRLSPFDIVTSRDTLDGIKAWLDFYNIDYRALVYIPDNKPQLDYKIYIDDNPNIPPLLADDQLLWLIDRPYNRHVVENHQIRRISSLFEIDPKIILE